MRPAKDCCLFLGLFVLFMLTGCDTRLGVGTGSATSGTDGTSGAGVAINSQSPRQAADAFLKDLSEGKATPDRLTTSYKKKLAPPGKDLDTVAREWLLLFKDVNFKVGEEGRVGDAIVVRGLAKFPNRSMAFTLRMVKDANGFKADWLHRSERQGSEIKSPIDSDLATAQDTVRNFVDIVLGGELRRAHSLMLPEWKRKLSPADEQDSREGYDYGRGYLDGKLRSWRSDFNSYTLSTGDLGPNRDMATFIATMDSGSMKTPYLVKATKDSATGEWLVSDFEKQQ